MWLFASLSPREACGRAQALTRRPGFPLLFLDRVANRANINYLRGLAKEVPEKPGVRVSDGAQLGEARPGSQRRACVNITPTSITFVEARLFVWRFN
ncbi:hypothetical protein AAFF_G00131230 [Aldrovandia affinis]|uniref:Uncharacterized protein n=1 Tax=Aldrovandia affinis TaxID=143900 RepID=A0AAD7RQX1_9TELE|nr:hypothetical protein AAFF_G00131230 [Aldrovandia affinis]